MRSTNRAPNTHPIEPASGKIGLVSAARLYPKTTSPFRLRTTSLRVPDATLANAAVASATPSMRPTVTMLAPSTVVRKTGRRLWTSSDDMSMNSEQKPSAQMLAGRWRECARPGPGEGASCITDSMDG